jgi:hypothetical protein
MSKKSIAALRPLKLALLATFALGAIGAGSDALAVTNNATASATATVITPMNITKNADLAFGKIAAGATSGTVKVSTSGGASVTGGTTTAGGTPTAANFTITGDNSATYAIDLTGTTATLTGAGTPMALALAMDFAGDGSGTTTVTTGALSGTGSQTLYVGGTLTVGASQVAGTYSGSIAVAVAYN